MPTPCSRRWIFPAGCSPLTPAERARLPATEPHARGPRPHSRQGPRVPQALGPDARELRLRATELRWYLTPLLRTPAAERAGRLALVPEDLRELVNSRVEQWDVLPPPLKKCGK